MTINWNRTNVKPKDTGYEAEMRYLMFPVFMVIVLIVICTCSCSTKNKDTGWVTVGSAGFSDGLAGDTNITFSPSGIPYVVYFDVF